MNASAKLLKFTFLLLASVASGSNAATITNDTLITAGNTNFEGADIVVRNCRLTVDGAHSFSSLDLQSGAELTHTPAVAGLDLDVTQDIVVGTDARISLDAIGFAGTFGPGAGRSSGSPLSGSGASHGGGGGRSASGAQLGSAYGSITEPINLGSGGGAGSGGVGGPGGGAIRLRAGGTIRVDGSISANGGDAVNARAGGGSGGSIWLTAATIAGSGSIIANGGNGEPSEGGGGGGGRITLVCDTNNFTGHISARGGSGANWGGAGTTWRQARSDPNGTLVLDNAGNPGSTFVNLSSPFALDLRSGVSAYTGRVVPLTGLLMASNSWLRLSNRTDISIEGDAILEDGSGIVADGGGSIGGLGVGPGSTYPSGFTTVGGGGGHGGYGGNGSNPNARGGNVYDQISNPTLSGSGGGGQQGMGGLGGGVIVLNVGGKLICHGVISANGTAGMADGAGGGSGGSVLITAGAVAGAGVIAANGGTGNSSGLYSGGGGGGGRIAINSSTNVFLGRIGAYGGDGAEHGGAGTVYLTSKGRTQNYLVVDNGGAAGTNTAWVSTGAVDATIRGGARLALSNPTALTFGSLVIASNSWIMAGTSQSPLTIVVSVNKDMRIESGGGISMDGAGFRGGQGPGAGRTESRSSGGGGGYGGRGGSGRPSDIGSTGTQPSGGNSYGSITLPREAGSGGGTGSGLSFSGGAGGGGLSLTVTGTLMLDGIISANGTSGTNGNAGGGSGGGIGLTVGTWTGRGSISANGGPGLGTGGGGGGGRIAINYGLNAFGGQLTAFGGDGFVAGGAGTVYLRPSQSGNNAGELLLDNGGLVGTNTPITGLIGPSARLTVVDGASALLSSPATPQYGFFSSLFVGSNSSLILSNTPIRISADAYIAPGGVIQADGYGYQGGQGPGAGRYYQLLTGDGGGYGGYGSSLTNGGTGGNAYGSVVSPRDLGSGGGAALRENGGRGGGLVQLNVYGALINEGKISANGAPGLATGAGGGAGGTVSITAASLIGSGAISSDGGPGRSRGGGGGGGRILISASANAFTGRMSAYGGSGAGGWGGAGTIYIKGPGTRGYVFAENDGHAGAPTLFDVPTVPPYYDLSILNGASGTASSLTVSNLFVGQGARLIGQRTSNSFEVRVEKSAVVAQGAEISVNGLGYLANTGSGRGLVQNQIGSGAGHGGKGGASAYLPGGASNGSPDLPTDLGSGGGAALIFPMATDSAGGGALRLYVRDSLTIDGTISANGNAGLFDGAGGGAGGSLWLSAATLTGTGLIAANGGVGEPSFGGGGGGGRIAIYSPAQQFRGSISVAGGPGFQAGEEGSFRSFSNLTPLMVTGQSPFGSLSTQPVSFVDITFNTPLKGSSILPANVKLGTPTGMLSGLSFTLPEPARLRISFPPQSSQGAYTVTLNPGIQNVYGESLSNPYQGSFMIVLPSGAAARLVDGNLLLSWAATAGRSYQPLWSTNFLDWVAYGPALLCTNLGGTLDLVFPAGTDSQKFFKIAPVE